MRFLRFSAAIVFGVIAVLFLATAAANVGGSGDDNGGAILATGIAIGFGLLGARIAGFLSFGLVRGLIGGVALLLISTVVGYNIARMTMTPAEREAAEVKAAEERVARAAADAEREEIVRREQEAAKLAAIEAAEMQEKAGQAKIRQEIAAEDRRLREKAVNDRENRATAICREWVEAHFQWRNEPTWTVNARSTSNGRIVIERDWNAQNGFGAERRLKTKCILDIRFEPIEIMIDGSVVYSSQK